MSDVVIDESVLVGALRVEMGAEAWHTAAAQLLLQVQERHRMVFSDDIARAYYRQISHISHKRSVAASTAIKSVTGVLYDGVRGLWVANPRRVVGEYDKDDQHVVGAAAAVAGSVLVTEDHRLRRALLDSGIAQRHRFTVVCVGEGVALLGSV